MAEIAAVGPNDGSADTLRSGLPQLCVILDRKCDYEKDE